MKKLILSLLLIAMFIPFVVNAETCDIDKISISSISLKEKSDNVEELKETTANGNNINLNLSMSEVGDNIEYNLLIKNESNEDYELDKTNLNLNSDYINYLLEIDDDSNIIKANSSKNVTLKIEYKTEVPEDKFENGIHNANQSMLIHLSTKNETNLLDLLKNPNTGNSTLYLSLLILVISGISFIIFKNTKYTKIFILFIGFSIIVPVRAYAVCKLDIIIDSNVQITKNNDFYAYTINTYDTSKPDNNFIRLNQTMPSTITIYHTPQEAMESFSNRPFFLKHKISNNIVVESYIGFVVTEDLAQNNPGMTAGTYYLRGGIPEMVSSEKPIYDENKATLLSAFGSSNCTEGSSDIGCSVPDLNAAAATIGNIATYTNDNTICFVNGGVAYCYE